MSSSVDITTELNDCGCCAGTAVETPASEVNRPGLSSIAYRVGTHETFKETLLARLSISEQPALRALTTRDQNDFSLALLDAWATVGDVLSFYQERIANEAYLRTATERFSVMELARLINYQLRPGVAASTYLAFTLDDAPGALGQTLTPGTTGQLAPPTLPPIVIDVGTKVQSVPGPNETAQTFETVEKIEARPEWNALKPRTTKLIYPALGERTIYLKGLANNLKVGDALLFVGDERLQSEKSDRWDLRHIKVIENQTAENRTKVILDRGLGSSSPKREPAAQTKVFVFRQRASIFGYNAPDWRGLPDTMKAGYLGLSDPEQVPENDPGEWPDFSIFAPLFPQTTKGGFVVSKEAAESSSPKVLAMMIGGSTKKPEHKIPKITKLDDTIDLDSAYQKITLGSWVLLSLPADPSSKSSSKNEFQRLFQATRVTEISRSDFAVSAKTSRLTLVGIDLDAFENAVRTTSVLVESEELDLAETPLTDPVWKQEIVLDRRVEGLQSGRTIIVTGKLLRRLNFRSSQQLQLPSGEFLLLEPAHPSDKSFKNLQWNVIDAAGFKSLFEAPKEAVRFTITDEEAAKVVSELAIIDSATLEDKQHTKLTLKTSLANVYDAATVVISANVAFATHGETTNEVLGGGDATKAFQHFVLKQPPLTYVGSADASGAVSTLEVRVNDVLWKEVADFYGHEPDERIYITRLSDDGKITVIFGDGQTGARLPTGQENVKAKYRKGIGLGGIVRADQLNQLMSRPLGVKGVTNPIASSGADDPEKLIEARRNAPLTVLTLGRVVSLTDYEDFASGFSGIGKALASWTWFGQVRGVFVTVAGSKGAAVNEDSKLYQNLLSALRSNGDPLVPLRVKSYQARYFKLKAKIVVDPDLIAEQVKAEVERKLRDTFSFDARQFGQPVHLSELISIIQNVTGVLSVDVDEFYPSDESPTKLDGIAAAVPQPSGDDISPGELLLLDSNGLKLEVVQ